MSRSQIRLHVQTCGRPESPSPICHPGRLPRRNKIGLTGQGACQLPGQSHHSLSCYLCSEKEMQPATEKPGASPETQRMMSSSTTGSGPAAPPTSALGNRVQSLHHFLQGHLFVSQPEPHSPQRRTACSPGFLCTRGASGEGRRWGGGPPAAPPARDWSRAPPRGRVGGLLGGSGSGARPASLRSHLGTQRAHPRAASEAFHRCTPGWSPGAPRAHPRIPRQSRARSSAPPWALDQWSRADRRNPPGPQPAARTTPPAPGLCALPGVERGAAGARVWSLPALTSGRPRAGAEAAATGRALPAPPHVARAALRERPVGSRWSGGRRLPKDARSRREARPGSGRPCLARGHPVRSIPGALQKPVMRVPGPSATPLEAQEPCVRRDPDCCPPLGADLTERLFAEQVPGSIRGLGNSSGQLMSTQGVPTSQLGVVWRGRWQAPKGLWTPDVQQHCAPLCCSGWPLVPASEVPTGCFQLPSPLCPGAPRSGAFQGPSS